LIRARFAGLTLLAMTMTGSIYATAFDHYTDRSEFNAAAPASMLLETFEALQVDGMTQILTSRGQIQKAVNSTNENEAFAPGDIQPNINFWLTADNSDSAIGWYVYRTGGNTLMMTSDYGLRITFDQPVSWFGIDIMNPFNIATAGEITLMNGSDQIDSASYSTAGFQGFYSSIAITSVEFSNSWVDFDNVTFNALDEGSEAPEPSSFLLAGAGIAGAWYARRLRRA